jgi:hypothetical protein
MHVFSQSIQFIYLLFEVILGYVFAGQLLIQVLLYIYPSQIFFVLKSIIPAYLGEVGF